MGEMVPVAPPGLRGVRQRGNEMGAGVPYTHCGHLEPSAVGALNSVENRHRRAVLPEG